MHNIIRYASTQNIIPGALPDDQCRALADFHLLHRNSVLTDLCFGTIIDVLVLDVEHSNQNAEFAYSRRFGDWRRCELTAALLHYSEGKLASCFGSDEHVSLDDAITKWANDFPNLRRYVSKHKHAQWENVDSIVTLHMPLHLLDLALYNHWTVLGSAVLMTSSPAAQKLMQYLRPNLQDKLEDARRGAGLHLVDKSSQYSESFLAVDSAMFGAAAKIIRGEPIPEEEEHVGVGAKSSSETHVLAWLDSMTEYLKYGDLHHLRRTKRSARIQSCAYAIEPLILSLQTCGMLRSDAKLMDTVKSVSRLFGFPD